MIINIGSLKGKKGAFLQFANDMSWQVAQGSPQIMEECSPLHVEGRISCTGRGFYAAGSVRMTLKLRCTRCLQNYEQELTGSFGEEFLPESQAMEISEEDVDDFCGDLSTFANDEVDLSQLLWDTILLSVPMKTICRPDCQGLCPSCGRSLNHEQCTCTGHTIDPRLADLADLLKE